MGEVPKGASPISYAFRDEAKQVSANARPASLEGMEAYSLEWVTEFQARQTRRQTTSHSLQYKRQCPTGSVYQPSGWLFEVEIRAS